MNRLLPFLIIILITISGCMIVKSPKKTPECPEPPKQNCQPLIWKGLPFDTSQNYRNIADYAYSIDCMKGINSNDDEWSLCFKDDKNAILTLGEKGQIKMLQVKLNTYNRATIVGGIGTQFEGSSGSPTIHGNSVIFAGSNLFGDTSNYIGNSDLYSGELVGNSIKNVVNLGGNIHKDKSTWESQPSLSSNGDIVFFASDREQLKGTEIYFSLKLKDGTWSEPINCGDSVNSDCDDITPYLSGDGKYLYFSSCGRETVGGYDLFSCKISLKFWDLVKSKELDRLKNSQSLFSNAKNLRSPLNTVYDEVFPSSPGDPDELLYYASNQNSGTSSIAVLKGGFDLFVKKKFERRPPVAQSDQTPELAVEYKVPLPQVKFPKNYFLYGKVYNLRTKETIPGSTIRFKQTEGAVTQLNRKDVKFEKDSLGQEIFSIVTDNTGSYRIEMEKDRTYEATAFAPNLFYDNYKFRMELEDPQSDMEHNFYLSEIMTLRVNFPYNVYNSPYKYALDSNGVETNQSWEEAIDLLAQNILFSRNELEKLVLIGNTDDQGTEDYNYKLGLNRVNFIIAQLILRGVPDSMLEGKSYGKTHLLEKRDDETMQMWRKRCRRVELQRVLKKS